MLLTDCTLYQITKFKYLPNIERPFLHFSMCEAKEIEEDGKIFIELSESVNHAKSIIAKMVKQKFSDTEISKLKIVGMKDLKVKIADVECDENCWKIKLEIIK